MPLSEHEQRMLEQIESALYAEDPKFASSVKRRHLGSPSGGRRRLQALAIFVLGLVLLVGGLIVDINLGGFPIVSLIGFLVMFGAGLLALWGGNEGQPNAKGADGARRGGKKRARGATKRKFSERMEDRFNRRFEQE